MSGSRHPRAAVRALGAAIGLLALSSCAYYNTYYLARRYFDRATEGQPYALEKAPGTAIQNYTKSIEYSKKVISNYPRSKWVDDAYVLWARGLLGRDDPIKSVDMLRDFPTKYPKSPLLDEATFYLGVAYRQARKPGDAVTTLDQFLEKAPRHDLAPYAHLERSRALMSLKRHAEAAVAAGKVVDEFPKSDLIERARLARAEARLAQGDYPGAQADYRYMGAHARSDHERFEFLLKEADALEAARSYAAELELLRDALSHELVPSLADTAARIISTQNIGSPLATTADGSSRYGRLQLRIGTVHALEGRSAEAFAAFNDVLTYYPRSSLGAEAQYRIAYTYETVVDDFASAQAEYGKVRNQGATSQFVNQAAQRQANLERLAQYRSAGGDSLALKSEAGFLLAELYLFQLDKPDRALTEYRKIALDLPGTPYAAKALVAEAWVLRNKYERPAEADSVLWRVVREHPATEAQLAARDYLEGAGHRVPAELIKLPEKPAPPPDSLPALVGPPGDRPLLGGGVRADSLARLGFEGLGLQRFTSGSGIASPGVPDSLRRFAARDSLRRRAPGDTLHSPAAPSVPRAPARPDTLLRAPADTSKLAPSPADTLRKRP